jgi:hypothetical protein
MVRRATPFERHFNAILTLFESCFDVIFRLFQRCFHAVFTLFQRDFHAAVLGPWMTASSTFRRISGRGLLSVLLPLPAGRLHP